MELIEEKSTIEFRAKLQWALLILGVLYSLTQLALSWRAPILDQYAFRQTQTAISAYWFMKGSAWIAYSTPVLGAPWSIPFELPLYQWLVAVVAQCLPFLTLDQAGRIVSELFFFACAWPLWRITTHYDGTSSLFRTCATLLLFSPIYVFWSRSFMMESAALFFSIWFVAALVDFCARSGLSGFFEMALTGALAACIKITTFVGFSFAGSLIVLYIIYTHRNEIIRSKILIQSAVIATAVALVILSLLTWLYFSDLIKSENLFGGPLTAESLKAWNFGTLKQRESWGIWKAILERAPNEATGTWLVAAVCLLYAIYKVRGKPLLIYLALLMLYLLPFMVFTNVHLIHHYYQYSNSIFLLLATGLVLWQLTKGHPWVGMALLACVISTEVYGYSRYFYVDMTQPNRELQMLLASYIRSHVSEDKVIVGFGLSWSSEVPYYSERRALFVPDSATPDMLAALSSDPSQYVGGMPIGAVIICPNKFADEDATKSDYARLVSALIKDRSPNIVGYCEVFQ